MSKVTISQVAEILKKHREITPAVLREVVEELNEATQPAADEDIKPPAGKKQYAVVVSDPNGVLKVDLTGWVVQLPENASPHSVVDRVMKAAHHFNTTKKGRLIPVKSVGEAFESIGRKFFVENELWVKTKLPVYLIRSDNKLTEAPTA